MMKRKIALDSVFHLCASLSLFSFCWGVFITALKPMRQILEGKRDYVQLKLQKRKSQGDRMASAESQVESPCVLEDRGMTVLGRFLESL